MGRSCGCSADVVRTPSLKRENCIKTGVLCQMRKIALIQCDLSFLLSFETPEYRTGYALRLRNRNAPRQIRCTIMEELSARTTLLQVVEKKLVTESTIKYNYIVRKEEEGAKMFKRITSIVLSISFVLCCFAGCGGSKVNDAASDTATDAVTETTTEKAASGLMGLKFSEEDTIKMSNYMNSGLASYSGSWIYGVNGNGALYKIKEDHSEENVLNGDCPTFINVISGWVYFTGYHWSDETDYIKKVRLSGEDDTTLVQARDSYRLDNMFIHDGKIYFSEFNENNTSGEKKLGSFCRCDLDGKNRETLIDRAIDYPYVIKGCILYQDDNDNERLHICNMDGSNDRVLIDHHVYNYIVYGTNLYYKSADDVYFDENGKEIDGLQYSLRYCNLDGSDDSVFLDLTNLGESFAIINGKLFYADRSDEDRLYVYDFASGAIDLVSQDTFVRTINSLDPSDKILYYDRGKKADKYYVEHIYICNPDGTGKSDMMK